jgi:hypothetical protein
MSRCTSLAALVVAVLAAAPVAAQPGGSIETSVFQRQTYSLTGSPSNQTDQFNPTGFDLFAYSLNHLNFSWPFYRVAGDTVQRPFGNYVKSDGFNVSGTSSWPAGGNGNTATYNWTDFGPGGVARFTAKETLTISTNAAGDAILSQAVQITNPSSTTPLSISLFELAVPKPGGDASRVFSASGGLGGITETSGGYSVTVTPTNATAYQLVTTNSLGNLLYGGTAGDLNNTGLPLTNYDSNATGMYASFAYEWTATIPPNSSQVFNSTIATAILPVPEPGGFALATVAAGVGLGWWRRRKLAARRRSAE